jgi:hypothetical protein
MSNVVLNKGELNRVVVTVSERSQLLDPYYLIVFTSKFSMDDVTTVTSVQDVSPATIRYNLFEITEQTAPNALLGQVHLIEGEWSYKIYESNAQTLNVSATTGEVLQQGLIIVKDENI